MVRQAEPDIPEQTDLDSILGRAAAAAAHAKYREFLLQTLERRRRKETAARSPDCASVGHLPFRSLALRATGRSDSRCRRKPEKCSDELLITQEFLSLMLAPTGPASP